MLNVVLLIKCDECAHAFSRAAVCISRDPMKWQSAIEEMKSEAKCQGWYFTKHCSLCEKCIVEECTRAKQMLRREEADYGT